MKYTDEMIKFIIDLKGDGDCWEDIAAEFNASFPDQIDSEKSSNAIRKTYKRSQFEGERETPKSPKVLIFDIETAPMLAYVWGLWDQNIGLNMIKEEWYVMSFAAKWLGDAPSKVIYYDQEGIKPQKNDKKLLKEIWSLLDEADVVITQNGIKFDQKKLNARFIMQGFKPTSSYRHIDTLRIAKKNFAFTSNKLAYMTDKLCVKYKKLSHGNFAGFSLWSECMNNNPEAWKEMKKYNKYDVLSLEELYYALIPYDNSIDFNVYHEGIGSICKCGSEVFKAAGFFYSSTGKFKKYKCEDCGHETRDKKNLLSKEKRKSLKSETAKK